MDSLLKTIFPCLPIRERGIQLPSEPTKHQLIHQMNAQHVSVYDEKKPILTISEAAGFIVTAMLEADKKGPSLDIIIESHVHEAGGWSEYLAKKVLATMEAVLKGGEQMNAAMQEACAKACEAAKVFEDFAADHPYATAVFCTVIALGVLVILAPYVLELLGFAELGPIEGKYLSILHLVERINLY